MRRRPQDESENHDRWLVSYADFITLLFAFFVVMFATAQTDNAKAQQVSDSVKKALAGQPLSTVIAAILGPGRAARTRPHDQPPKSKGTDPESARVAELVPSLNVLSKELEDRSEEHTSELQSL